VIHVRTKRRHDRQTPLTEAQERFGGFDLPAALAGMLAALGLTVLLAGIAAAAGTVSYSNGADTLDLASSGLVTGMAVLLVAFLVGGWVAGRMARYDGVLNGLTCAALFLLLMAGLSAVGDWADSSYDFFADVRLPQWFTNADTSEAAVSAAVGVGIVLLAAALGGAWGGRYHRKADALIVTGDTAGMDYLERSAKDYEGRHAVR